MRNQLHQGRYQGKGLLVAVKRAHTGVIGGTVAKVASTQLIVEEQLLDGTRLPVLSAATASRLRQPTRQTLAKKASQQCGAVQAPISVGLADDLFEESQGLFRVRMHASAEHKRAR